MINKLFKIVLLTLFIEVFNVEAQVIINEVSSVNYDAYCDEDNSRPDWIELYNPTDSPVNLEGWKISDRDDIHNAWSIPKINLPSKEWILIQASGKNYSNSGKFIIEAAGYGIFPHALNDSYRFQYTELSGDFEFSVRIHSLQDIDVFGSTGVIVREDLTNTNRFFGILSQREDRYVYEYLYRADTSYNNRYPIRIYSKIEDLYPQIVLSVKRKGDSITASVNDIKGYCLESNTMYWDFPEKVYVGIALSSTNPNVAGRGVYSNLNVNGEPFKFENLKVIEHDLNQPGKSYFSKELHTNFSISGSGETIYLWNSAGKLADKIELPAMYVDMSYSRIPDASKTWKFSMPPTPNKQNDNPKNKILKQPIFSLKPGFYSNNQSTTIKILDNNANCYYTTDGSEPDEKSKLYNGEIIFFNETTTLKARVYSDGAIPSQIETATYLIAENTVGMPVVSISSNPDYFFSEQIGIFHRIFDDFEYPCSFEYFDTLGNRNYSNRFGVKIHGNSSLKFAQKSMRFHTRSKYGENEINYPFFGPGKPDSFDKLILRNGGQDWNLAFLRNSYVNRVAFGIKNLESTYSKAALVYLNGDFWGMFNLFERADEDFLSARYQVSDTSFSIFEQNFRLLNGEVKSYIDVLDSLSKVEYKDNNIYNLLNNNIDIDNFIKYTTFSFYLNNDDWPTNNFKTWKSTELDNKWRWIVYDMDLCLASGSTSYYSANHFLTVMDWVKEDSNFYHIAYILRTALQDELFRIKYLNTTCDLLNSTLLESNMNLVLDSILYDVTPAVPLQRQRWEESMTDFENQVVLIKEFIKKRPRYYRSQLSNYFNLSGISKVELSSDIDGACTFSVNSLEKLNNMWEGYYFNDIPIEIVHHPNHGFKFKHWLVADSTIIVGDTLKITLTDSTSIKAIFEESVEPIPGMVVINEIMYKSADDIDSDDWIELYNPGEFDVDISGWLFKDDNDGRQFIIPNNTILAAGRYQVLINSKKKFNEIYPEVKNYKGEFTFGLGTEDMVRIYDKAGKTIDSVKYTNKAPWPTEADGLGPTLELISPFLDNSLASSWRSLYLDGGTPGTANSATDVIENYTLGNLKLYPNPTISYANIEFALEYSGNIEIIVTDILGNHVRKILSGFFDAGNYSSFWDGTDDYGNIVGKGVYILNIKTNLDILRGKLILE